MHTLLQTIRHAARSLRHSPGAAVMAIASLAIAIGVNTSMFSAYDAVALKRLPVEHSRNLVRLERWFSGGARGDIQFSFSWQEFLYLQGRAHAFGSIVASTDPRETVCYVRNGLGNTTASEHAEQFLVVTVSNNFFSTLGTEAVIGRVFAQADHSNDSQVVLSYPFWKRRFHSDTGSLGMQITVGGIEATVIGVSSPSFIGAGAPPVVPDMWVRLPAGEGPSEAEESNARFMLLASLNPGVGARRAEAETELLLRQLARLHPPSDATIAVSLRPATYFAASGELWFKVVAGLVMLAGALLLFVACANLINLLLARATSRRRELGTRLALGASRTRLIAQLLTESTLLAFSGAAAGLVLSTWCVHSLWSVAQGWIEQFLGAHSFVLNFDPDIRIFSYTAALALAAGVAFGILPALRASKLDIVSSLKDEGAGGESLARLGPRGLFLASQVAVTVLLLVIAGLLLRSLSRARTANPGFAAEKLVALSVDSRRSLTIAELLSRLPQVTVVARTDRPPFLGHSMSTFSLPGGGPGNLPDRIYVSLVSSTYFDALGLHFLRGRGFSAAEPAGSAIVSEFTARRLWPGVNPIGRRIELTAPWMPRRLHNFTVTVIGVVQDARTISLSQVDPTHVYVPLTTSETNAALLIRARDDSATAIPAIRAALWQFDKTLAVATGIIPLKDAMAVERALMSEIPLDLAAGLGIFSVLLAITGIFGLTSYVVTARTREIGLRVALGATRIDVLTTIFKSSLSAVFWGGCAGGLLSLILVALLRASMTVPDAPNLLFGVNPLDGVTFTLVLLFITAVAVSAAYAPARRAARVDPMVALRYE